VTRLALLATSASTIGERVDRLFAALVAVTGVMALAIFALIFWFAVRYRRREGAGPPPQNPGHLGLEVTWTAVPLAVFLGLFAWASRLYVEESRLPPDAEQVYVVAKQWMWKFQHPEGAREADVLHVPVGRPVRLLMTSEDVIHSFYVPAFRLKMDVLPGRYTTTWFEATRTGAFHLFCAEYCGTKHSGMVGRVVVLDPEDYQRWLARTDLGRPLADSGAELFEQYRCSSCHAAEDTERGPALGGLLGRRVRLASGETVVADPAYLRESLLEPAARVVAGYAATMPTYEGQLTEEQILQLLAHVQSLPAAETAR